MPVRDACARMHSPGAALGVRPLQHVQVAAACGVDARVLVPRAAVVVRPLHDGQVAMAGS